MAEEFGTGKFFWKNGAVYDGEWKLLNAVPPPTAETDAPKKGKPKGKKEEEEAPAAPAAPPKRVRHGKGAYKEHSYSYEGEWVEDEMHGVGKFVFESGASYEGQWVKNKYEGKGTYQWPDGRSYEGDWIQGRMHGQGVYTDASGHKWSGQFFNGSGPGLTCQL